MKAIGRVSSPASSRTLLKKPRPGNASNIQRQVRAMITVEVTQGSSSRPRKKLRQRQVACSTSAMARPVSTLSATDATVKTRLFRTTVRNVSSWAR